MPGRRRPRTACSSPAPRSAAAARCRRDEAHGQQHRLATPTIEHIEHRYLERDAVVDPAAAFREHDTGTEGIRLRDGDRRLRWRCCSHQRERCLKALCLLHLVTDQAVVGQKRLSAGQVDKADLEAFRHRPLSLQKFRRLDLPALRQRLKTCVPH
eukprot:5862387-Prymnesium_polylepis.2